MSSHNRRVEVDRQSDVPLYEQIAEIIRGRIEAGRESGVEGEYSYPPGSLIPSIERIRQETGCTVLTIRKGIGLLADMGLVTIRPGKGTFVVRDEK